MCDTAYHNEALRKARVLERKQQLEGMHQVMHQEAGGAHGATHVSEQQRKYLQANCHTGTTEPNQSYSWPAVQRELRAQAKTLRDHNLCMGPMESFKKQYDNGSMPVEHHK